MSDDLTDDEFKVHALAQSGIKLPALAEHLGRSEEDVRADLERVLARKHPEVPPAMGLELDRLDTLTKAVWTKAVGGDVSAIKGALDVSKRRVETIRQLEEDKRKRAASMSPGAELQQAMDELLRKTLEQGNVGSGSTEVLNTESAEG